MSELQFDLTDDDYYAIDIAKNIVFILLKYPNIKSQQIIGLGNALYALEQLPKVTVGASCGFGIVYRYGTEEINEMRYFTFNISEDIFEISIGGSVYDKSVGSDSFSRPGWYVELGGYRKTECDLYTIEDSIEEYINLGAKLSVYDSSKIEYEQSDDIADL